MLPNEYKLNKSGETAQEVFGVDYDTAEDSKDTVQLAAFAVFEALTFKEWSILGFSIQAVTDLEMRKPLDVLEYFMKSLDRQAFLDWALSMAALAAKDIVNKTGGGK